MSDEEAQADDFSGLTGFFFYVFIVHPCTAWILKPGRFERKKSIMYAIAFLAAIAAVKTGLEWNDKGPNYYAQLGVTRVSSPAEIKRSYRKLSLQVHPDKNPSPDASRQFDALKQAYDVLMDIEFREVYNKFGREGIASNKRFDETQFLKELGIFYVTWGMLVFMLTLGKKSGDAREWCFTGMLCMMVLEVVLVTSQTSPIPDWLFPQLTEYEVVWLLHNLFPAFMNGCRSLGAYLFVDLDAQTRKLLLALQEQNKDVLLVLREVQIGVQTLTRYGVSGGGGSAPRVGAEGNVVASDEQPMMATSATPTGKLKELQTRLRYSNASVAQAVQQLKPDESKSSNMGFYLMVLGYIFVAYVFNN